MITPGIVVFDAAAFTATYCAFAKLPSSALQQAFDLATLELNNTYQSVVPDEPTRAQLLNLLTAHFAATLYGVDGQPPTGSVGRITTASEGSVSVSTDFRTDSEAASFWSTTVWGSVYWRLTARFRLSRYIAPCNTRVARALGDLCHGWPL